MSNIIEYSFKGNLSGIVKELKKDPDRINQQQKYTLNDGHSVTLTPLFAAAVAGRSDLVKNLITRGASFALEGADDLFTWTCLCPNREARIAILDFLDDKKFYQQIREGLRQENAFFAIGERPESFEESSEFVETALLSGTLCECITFDEFFPYLNAPTFRGMTPVEIKTYRVAIGQMLQEKGIVVPDPNPNFDLQEGVAIGHIETLRKYNAGKLFANTEKGVFSTSWTLFDVAARCGRVEVFKFLQEERDVKVGEEFRADIQSGNRLIEWMPTRYGHLLLLKYLRDECQFDLNAPFEAGMFPGFRPVHIAILNDQFEAFKFFIEECHTPLDCIMEDRSHKGWRLQDYAAEHGRVDVLEYLQTHGVDLSVPKELIEKKKLRTLLPAELGKKHLQVRAFFERGEKVHQNVS